MTEEERAFFNFKVYRIVGRTIRECFFEAYGYRLLKGPTLPAIRTIISLTAHYGIPETERDLVKLVRQICQDHGLPPLTRN